MPKHRVGVGLRVGRLHTFGFLVGFFVGLGAAFVCLNFLLAAHRLDPNEGHFALSASRLAQGSTHVLGSTSSHCQRQFDRLMGNHTSNLTGEDFRRSRGWHGNERRLQNVVDVLDRRERPLVVVVAGGSITLGHGLSSKEFRYSNRLEEWLNTQFPLSGNQRHRVLNVGSHGADMCAVAKHLRMMLRDVSAEQMHPPDLFILEFAVNDYQGQDHKIHLDHKTDVFFEGFQRLALCSEAVVRKLLQSHQEAAVVFLEFQTAILNRKTAQLLHSGVAQHYQIPLISYSEALFPAFYDLLSRLKPYDYALPMDMIVDAFPHGCSPCLDQYIDTAFRDKGCKSLCTFMSRSGYKHLTCENDNGFPVGRRKPCFVPFFAHDAVHPSMVGHEIATNLVIHAIAQAQRNACQGEVSGRSLLPLTTWLGSPKELDGLVDFVMVKDTMQVFSKQDPLVSQNYSSGFALTGDSFAERRGWIAMADEGGQFVHFKVDLPPDCYVLSLGVLKSYEGMGTMQVAVFDEHRSLIRSVDIDGIWEPRISIPNDVVVTTPEAPCGGSCIVEVRTNPKVSGRSGNKVKIMSLAAQKCKTTAPWTQK